MTTLRDRLRNSVPAWKTDYARVMRKNPTQSEAFLWQHLRKRRLFGLRFRRQVVLRGYIADFYCSEANLAIELDGSLHDFDANSSRDTALLKIGIHTLRFASSSVFSQSGLKALRSGVWQYLSAQKYR